MEIKSENLPRIFWNQARKTSHTHLPFGLCRADTQTESDHGPLASPLPFEVLQFPLWFFLSLELFLHHQTLIESCQGIHNDLHRLAHIIGNHSNSNWGDPDSCVFWIFFLFSATLSALITITQRSAAWIPTMAILGVVAAVFTLQELHRHPGKRRKFLPV